MVNPMRCRKLSQERHEEILFVERETRKAAFTIIILNPTQMPREALIFPLQSVEDLLAVLFLGSIDVQNQVSNAAACSRSSR